MYQVTNISVVPGPMRQPPYLEIEVLMDDSKVDAKGNPDPNFLRPFTYKMPPDGVTMDDWITQILQDIIPTIEAELPNRLNPPPDPLAKWKGHKFQKGVK